MSNVTRTNTTAPVQLAPYDPTWPQLFEQERAVLADTLLPWLVGPIEHIGSTAIQGMAAKPVIDIMAAVRDLDSSRPAIVELSKVGYCYWPYRETIMHWFCKPSEAIRTHHLHLVPIGSQLWLDRLTFRDFLRGNPNVAADYASLKQELARRYEWDREAYTDGKRPFVERILELAARGKQPSEVLQASR